jgi:CHAT domain-containing protein
MTRSFATQTCARGAVILCLSALAGEAWALPVFAAARDSANAQNVGSPQPSTQASATQDSQDVTRLELGKPIERELAGGQRHIYVVPMSEGQYMKVEVTDRGTDVGVSLQTPDGLTMPYWMPRGRNESAKGVGQMAGLTGLYKLTVYAMEKASPGRYEIRLTELRPATEKDRALHEANESYKQYALLKDQGKNLEARAALFKCLDIREKILGPGHLVVADTLGYVSASYDNAGDYANAELYQLRALKIKEKALGPDHPDVADELAGLGVMYRNKNDYVKAEEVQKRAWKILEKAQLTETTMGAAILQDLGTEEFAMGNSQSAEEYYQRAHIILEKTFGPDHFHLAASFTFLGSTAYLQGDYAKAETMFQKALTLAEKGLGPDHLVTTKYRNDVAMLYCTTGDYARGEALYEKSLAAHERRASMSYPPVQTSLFGLARCFAAQGNWPEAVKFQAQASEIAERYVALNIVVGSEREKQAFLSDLSLRASRNISLQTQFAHNDPTALHLAVTTVLQNKGRVQDAVANSLSALRQRFGPEDDHKLLEQLGDLNSQLAKLVLNGPQRMPPAEYQQRIKGLEDQREQLEGEMNRRTAGFYESQKPFTLSAIQAAIPENGALIEFAVYQPFDPKAPDNENAYGQPHYVAYVVRHHGEVEWQELGKARSVDTAIDSLRQALRDPQRKDVQQLARAVDERIMQPVRALAGDAKHLLISPDGELNLIPFEALVDEQGRYLAERYAITYLTTGRDLLRMQVTRESKSKPVVVADPLFGEAEPTPAAAAQARLTPASAAQRRRNTIAAEDLSQVYFAPLSGTAQEARVIHSLFPAARVFTGTQATKSALQRLIAPRILHIATHGFFLQDANAEASRNTSGPGAKSGRLPAFKIEEPLLRSGLALAGANLNRGSGREGILTALEASNLNLWGTKLVTLSACETGVGEVRNGEGVYGLRRAFFLAGTETLVMSLWPVSDRVTREMMTTYYTGLNKGLGRGEALRQAQLAMLKRKGREHPFYWASFIQSGEWADLDGHR